MQQALDAALSDIFFTNFSETEGGLKKALYQFDETVLSNMTRTGTLDELFSCCIEHGHSIQCLGMHLLHAHSHDHAL